MLILASTSPYRRELLLRFGIPFEVEAPHVDETVLPGECARNHAIRLALAKAHAVASRFPAALVIGSDQSAEHAGRIVGKPLCEARAVEQLLSFSGAAIEFHTAVAVVCLATAFHSVVEVRTTVRYRALTEDEARRYVRFDHPLDCAGSFKSESAGPTVLRSMESADPTAIVGLPLIELARLLREAGLSLP